MLYEIRLVACASMLVLAAIIDFKKREIPDKVWIIFGGLGAVITAFEILAMPSDTKIAADSSPNVLTPDVLAFGIQIGIIAPIACLMYRTGFFGGADSKALVAIALLFPFYTAPSKLHEFSALTVLTNAAILSMSHVVYNVTRNLASLAKGMRIFDGFEDSIGRKALALMMGYRAESPTRGFLFSMEVVAADTSGRRKFNFSPSSYDDYVDSEKKDIWVTTALPFIVYMAAGFVIMISFGDILAAIVFNLH